MSLPRLVLVPGLLNDAELWRDQLDGLRDVARPVVADITRGATLDEMAEAVLAVAGPRFALAGFSLGGIVALEVMRRAAERVSHLALLDTTMLPDDADRAAERARLVALAQTPGSFHGFGEKVLLGYLAPQNVVKPAIAGRIRSMTARLGPEVFVRQSRVARPDNRALLGTLDCPVLVLCGEHDSITPPAMMRSMAADIPRSRFVLLRGSGHMTPIETPERVTEELRALLARDVGAH
ncbi:alpha/beta fold hydrolase [Salipiger sp.]|uniref:alpha/beta fold hydrolase n=1 Tax=Salipiger sp. TaxID=2078585 RepID=UPI003A970A9D